MLQDANDVRMVEARQHSPSRTNSFSALTSPNAAGFRILIAALRRLILCSAACRVPSELHGLKLRDANQPLPNSSSMVASSNLRLVDAPPSRMALASSALRACKAMILSSTVSLHTNL